MNDAYLLIGGNIGDRLLNLEKAILRISETCGKIIHCSSIYETAAWGNTDQAAFLNQVLLINTDLSPNSLLERILAIELEMGRKRTEKYAARIIDIDILYFNQMMIETEALTIPHPKISERKFVLVPLNEIAEHFLDIKTGFTIDEMLKNCKDDLPVDKYPRIVDKKED